MLTTFPLAGPTRLELATSGVTGPLGKITHYSLLFVFNTLRCCGTYVMSLISMLFSRESVTNLSPNV